MWLVGFPPGFVYSAPAPILFSCGIPFFYVREYHSGHLIRESDDLLRFSSGPADGENVGLSSQEEILISF